MSDTKVKVKSPTALERRQLDRIGEVIKKFTDDNVVVKNDVDEKMLGGIKVEFGTNIIDLTMEKLISELQEEINE